MPHVNVHWEGGMLWFNHCFVVSESTGTSLIILMITQFLAPPAERQRSFSNTDLSVRPSVCLSVRPSCLSVRPSCPSVKIEGGEGSISETLQ